jgi:hypothetical protein
MKLSDISQSDAFDILTRASHGCALTHFFDQLYFTTPQLCSFFQVERTQLLPVLASSRDEVINDGYRVVEGEDLANLAKLDPRVAGRLSVDLWPPRAALRVAIFLDNPIALSVFAGITAFHAADSARRWSAATCINGSSTLQGNAGHVTTAECGFQGNAGQISANAGQGEGCPALG